VGKLSELPPQPLENVLAEFDSVAANYQELVDHNVRITGESSDYFAAYKAEYVARKVAPRAGARLLDYGCGVGLLSSHLNTRLDGMRIDGFDVSNDSVGRVNERLLRQGTFSANLNELGRSYDVVVLSNVLHHVKPGDRRDVIREAASHLADGGKLVIFEHNPVNPLTRWAVSQCSFDEDAILLPSRETQAYFEPNELRPLWRDYIVFFPRWLRWLRHLEASLNWCPLGAQYVVVAARLRR
jgi:2-polyprenyl-3-methyl-5-hydroxy-6-metoxy-1,4-benzoquinol methylase